MPIYRVTVFSSPAALNASYPSLIRRLLGISPWWITAATAPLLATCLVLSIYLVDEREQMLAAEGLAPIVKLARLKDHWELAARHGSITTLSSAGNPRGGRGPKQAAGGPHDRLPHRRGVGLRAMGSDGTGQTGRVRAFFLRGPRGEKKRIKPSKTNQIDTGPFTTLTASLLCTVALAHYPPNDNPPFKNACAISSTRSSLCMSISIWRVKYQQAVQAY